MISLINLAVLFVAKVADNALSTTKTILVQRSRWILAGIAVIISDFIYFWITKRVVSANNEIAMLVVAVAGGVGCSLACFINEKMSKDRTYVNVIMSDDLEEMKHLRDFLAQHHITNVASDATLLTGTQRQSLFPLIQKQTQKADILTSILPTVRQNSRE